MASGSTDINSSTSWPKRSTLGTFLRAFTFGHVRQLDRVLAEAIKRAWARGRGSRPQAARDRPRQLRRRGPRLPKAGLLRQYLPKGSDLAARSQVELDEIAAELNDRPRQTLGWMKPSEKMAEPLR